MLIVHLAAPQKVVKKPAASVKSAKKKRSRDEVHQEGDDVLQSLSLLPAGIQAEINANATDMDGRANTCNTYLNGLLAVLPEEKQKEVLAVNLISDRIALLIELTAHWGKTDKDGDVDMFS
jgi:hypothetical protein